MDKHWRLEFMKHVFPKLDRPCRPRPFMIAGFFSEFQLVVLSLSTMSMSPKPFVGDAETGGEHGRESGPVILLSGLL